ncbi:MAG TPA: helix-turn-helix domain-containing protein [Bacteroidales bacterium]|nr:helix-turn-helix domain-containing protein [Bacteroidales bacterium]HUX95683.1 helix-turn-helix domain-containing protein [Bacteroidales bacterium]
MPEKFLVTNYDHEELVSLIKEAFTEELKEILTQKEKEKDYNVLLSRREVADLLKISLVTLHKYQKEGILPYSKLGIHIYFKKGDIMKALETQVRYQHRR